MAAPDALGAVVLVDAEGRAAVRLPLATWAPPHERARDTAGRVAAALDLPVVAGVAPSGGDVLDDPPGPSTAPLVLLSTLAALPLVVAGLLSLDPATGAGGTILGVLCAAGLAAILGALLAALAARASLSSGERRREPGALTRAEWAEVGFPVWAGTAVAVAVLLLPVLPPGQRWPFGGLLGLVVVLGVAGIGLVFRRRAANAAWLRACLVPTVLSGAVGLAALQVHPRPSLAWPAVAVGAAGVVLFGLVSVRAVRRARAGTPTPDSPSR